ncbi:MAG: helix-turn-helix domain-containing protein [Burkholderiales bacterium]|nr:helix-turn-helix domain-containing protein [Burkholderiales bacterium]
MTEPTGALTQPTGVGAELARARQSLGLSVAQVAQQLKLAPRQVEALEAEAWERLPAGPFARGMLRSYARVLGLDAEALLARVGERLRAADPTDAPLLARRAIPFTDGTRRLNLVYGALYVAVHATIAFVALEWRAERARAARPTFVPAAAQAPAPPPPPRLELASVAPTGATETPVAEAAPAARRLVLRFERDAWVEIRGAGDRLLMSQLNPAGSERAVEGEPPFRLVIGNARHVRLIYEGAPVDLAPHIKVEVARLTLP